LQHKEHQLFIIFFQFHPTRFSLLIVFILDEKIKKQLK